MSELEDEIERLKSELEKARGHAAHLADALDWMERERGWVAKDTPLPTFVGNMRKELEAAVLERDNCKSLWMQGIKKVEAAEKACAELREAIETLWPHCDLKAFGGSKPKWLLHALSANSGSDYEHKSKREEVEKACAEMRRALIPFQCETCNGTHQFTFECPSCLSGEGECTCDKQQPEPCPQCQSCDDIKKIYGDLERALSTDCGKDYIHKDEVKPLVESLTETLEHVRALLDIDGRPLDMHDRRIIEDAEKALAHWRKEK